MDVEGDIHVPAPPEVVWARLIDPAVLKRCIPGCTRMTRLAPHRFEAEIEVRYGPVHASFLTDIALTDVVAPAHYVLSGRGHGGLAGVGEGRAEVRLDAAPGGTAVRYRAALSAAGALGRIGSRLLGGTTRRLIDRFFAAFLATFDEDPVSGADRA
jgi:uncharacterized protein